LEGKIKSENLGIRFLQSKGGGTTHSKEKGGVLDAECDDWTSFRGDVGQSEKSRTGGGFSLKFLVGGAGHLVQLKNNREFLKGGINRRPPRGPVLFDARTGEK